MASTYTVNLGIEKIATGEQSGTWGATTNTNFDLIDQAVNGAVTVTLASAGTSGVPNTLAITDGAASNGRNKFIEFNDSGDLGASAYVQLTPNDAEKLVHIRNSLSGGRTLILFQGTYNASNDFEVPNGKDVVLKFDGAGASATVTDVFTDLQATAITTPDLTATTVDINGGTIDGVTIGGSSAGAGSFTTLTASGDVNFDSGTLFVDESTNRVGVGTTSPATLLNTKGASLTSTTDKREILIEAHDDGVTNSQGSLTGITFRNSPTTYTAGSFNRTSGIYGLNEDAAGFGRSMGLAFYTATNDATATERMRIDASGNVGIGNSNPAAFNSLSATDKLVIGDSTVSNLTLFGTQYGSLAFADSDASGSTAQYAGLIQYYHTDNSMQFYTGSTERMRIDSLGNVGIGTSSPATALDVSGQITTRGSTGAFVAQSRDGSGAAWSVYNPTGDDLRFFGNSDDRMTLTNAGNVGIGTSSPTGGKLQIDVGGSLAGVRVSGITGSNQDLYAVRNGSSSIQEGPNITLQTATGTTYATTMQLGPTGETLFFNYNGSAWNERMRLDASGNVGIGTSSPSVPLEVNVSGTGDAFKLTRDAGANGELTIDFGGANANFNSEQGGYNFETSSATNVLVLSPAGNVGIGTASPDGFVDINQPGTNADDGLFIYSGDNPATGGLVLYKSGSALGTIQPLGASGQLSFNTFSGAEAMRLDASGNLLVGRTSVGTTGTGHSIRGGDGVIFARAGGEAAIIARNGDNGQAVRFDCQGTNGVGSIDVTTTATSYVTSSDARLKENIADAEDAGAKVDAIQVRQFDWKADGSHQDYGMIAQELMTVAPEAVSGDPESDDMMGVDYSKLVPMLVKEIQSLRARVHALEGK